MAHEEILLNNAQITPARLHALVRAVSRLQTPKSQDILDALQPPALRSDQSAADIVYSAALHYRLIIERSDKTVVINGSAAELESVQDFRRRMQQIVLEVVDQNQPNYLFSLYTSWYAVQNERVFRFEGKDPETKFLLDMKQDEEARTFNMTKFNGWRGWTPFLGLGWSTKPRPGARSEIIIPDASGRLQGALPQLLQEKHFIPFGVFAERLSRICPELDGGELFRKSWEASRRGEQRGNRLSLMLSTGLRQLHEAHIIELYQQADTTENWQLYPVAGSSLGQITHIRLEGK